MALQESQVSFKFAGGVCAMLLPMPKKLDLTGRTFGNLVAQRDVGSRCGFRVWQCRCVCGRETEVLSGNLVSGTSKSCGCLSTQITIARNTTHNLSKHPLYTTWKNMRARCSNTARPDYHRYGGRGIKICARWSDFATFLADVGERPDGMTIERLDNNGNYEPGNVAWACRLRQGRNREMVRMSIEIANAVRGEMVRTKRRAEQLAAQHGVTIFMIRNVWYGASWRNNGPARVRNIV